MTTNKPDIALWEAFRNGDSMSLGLLFRKYYPSLFQYGSKLTTDEALLEDCIQDLFTELWQNRSQRDVLFVKAYLLKSLKYKLFRALQKKSAGLSNDNPDDLLFELSHETLLVNKEENKAKTGKIMLAFDQLTNRQKEIIYLKFYQELSYEEVSEIMNINYQAARNLLYQSIKSLKKLLTVIAALLIILQ